MKRLIALLLTACMTISLAACGGSSNAAASAEGKSAETEASAEQKADNSGKKLTVDIWDSNQQAGLQKIAD